MISWVCNRGIGSHQANQELSIDPDSLDFAGYVPYPKINQETRLSQLLLCLFFSFFLSSLLNQVPFTWETPSNQSFTFHLFFCSISMFRFISQTIFSRFTNLHTPSSIELKITFYLKKIELQISLHLMVCNLFFFCYVT